MKGHNKNRCLLEFKMKIGWLNNAISDIFQFLFHEQKQCNTSPCVFHQDYICITTLKVILLYMFLNVKEVNHLSYFILFQSIYYFLVQIIRTFISFFLVFFYLFNIRVSYIVCVQQLRQTHPFSITIICRRNK